MFASADIDSDSQLCSALSFERFPYLIPPSDFYTKKKNTSLNEHRQRTDLHYPFFVIH